MGGASDTYVFGRDHGLIHEAVVTSRKAGWGHDEWAKLAHNEALMRDFREVLLGHASIAHDSIIRVNRAVHPDADYMSRVLHPELEVTGLVEYNLAALEMWLHLDQKAGNVKGWKIYQYLKENKILEKYLNLRDLQEIEKKGADVFRKYFGDKMIFAWKSVIRNQNGLLEVPGLFLRGFDASFVLGWCRLDDHWNLNSPAPRFK